MEIKLDDENSISMNMRYIGDKCRSATITDVKFIDDVTILCASFSGCFLLIYDLSKSICVEKIYTCVKSERAKIDLIYLYDNKIYVTHIEKKCIGEYLLKNNKITFSKFISTKMHGKPHGIYCNDNSLIYTTVNTCSIIFNDKKIYKHANGSQMQSVSIYNNKIIACGTYSPATRFSNKYGIKSFIVVLFKNYDNTYSSQCFEYNDCRYDGMCIYENKLFICDQYNSNVLFFEIHDKDHLISFELIKKINDVSFCHGCDYYNDKLAVACYGTCSVKIFDM